MRDFLFIFFTISIVTGLIYFLYKLMLDSERAKSSDEELQITPQELLEQLRLLYKERKYNIVETLAKKYLEKKSADDAIRTVLAKVLYDQKKFFDSIDHAKIILKHKSHNPDVQILLANCYFEVDKPMKAITVLQELLECDSENVVAIKELARLYYVTNQKRSSIKMYQRLEEFLYSNVEIVNNKVIIAETYIEFLDYHNAKIQYEEILKMYPNDMRAKKRVIELNKLLEEYDDAISHLLEIVNGTPSGEDYLWALDVLMNIYTETKQFEKALECANKIKEHPESNEIQSGEDIAKILLEQGDISNSITMLKDLLSKEPSNFELKKILASAYEQDLNFAASIELYSEILSEVEAYKIEGIKYLISDTYANWAMYLFSLGDNSECFKSFSLALEYNSKNPNIYFQIGNVNRAIKNFNESISQYKKAIDLDPKNADYYYALACSYNDIESIYERKKALDECIKLAPEHQQAHFELGGIYYQQNDTANAIMHLKKAAEINELFVEAKKKLALLYEHIGNKEEAIKLYEKILKLDPQNQEIAENLRMLKS